MDARRRRLGVLAVAGIVVFAPVTYVFLRSVGVVCPSAAREDLVTLARDPVAGVVPEAATSVDVTRRPACDPDDLGLSSVRATFHHSATAQVLAFYDTTTAKHGWRKVSDARTSPLQRSCYVKEVDGFHMDLQVSRYPEFGTKSHIALLNGPFPAEGADACQ